MENMGDSPAGVMDMAREVVNQAREEYTGMDAPAAAAGYEPFLIRHIAAALEVVEAEVDEARGRGDSLARELAQARADLQDQTDENERVRIEIQRGESPEGVPQGEGPLAKPTDPALYRATRRPEIPATERVLAGLPASVDWPKIAEAEDSAFLRGKRAPYEKPTVVPWEVRFAEIVADRVKLRDRVDDLLASNSLEVQKRRAAEVLAAERLELLEIARRQGQKNAATAVGLFDDQYAILSRYRVALMACRDYSGPVDQIVREALEEKA